MLITNKARSIFTKYAYIETFILVCVYLAVGYWLSPDDICLLNHSILPLAILLAVVTLFHGITSGLLAIVMIGIAMKFGYAQFDYRSFLGLLVLVLIFGEFHYYWNKVISRLEGEAAFNREKLQELGNAFYMLKISHDQIERSYIVKPMSIRNSISVIKKEFYDTGDRSDCYQNFIKMLKKTFSIEKAVLVEIENERTYKTLAISHDTEDFDPDDLLVKDAYEKQQPLYVSDFKYHVGSRYLAAIPSVVHDRVVGMFIIEKMPFLSFNKDTLVSISILTDYIFIESKKVFILKNMNAYFPQFGENFRFETYRVHKIWEQSGVLSSLLVFRTSDDLTMHRVEEIMRKNLRTPEVLDRIEINGIHILAVLFPFNDTAFIDGFMERINRAKDIESILGLESIRISISQLELLHSFVHGK